MVPVRSVFVLIGSVFLCDFPAVPQLQSEIVIRLSTLQAIRNPWKLLVIPIERPHHVRHKPRRKKASAIEVPGIILLGQIGVSAKHSSAGIRLRNPKHGGIGNRVVGVYKNLFFNLFQGHAVDLGVFCQLSPTFPFGKQHHHRDFVETCGIIPPVLLVVPSLPRSRQLIGHRDQVRIEIVLRQVGIKQAFDFFRADHGGRRIRPCAPNSFQQDKHRQEKEKARSCIPSHSRSSLL